MTTETTGQKHINPMTGRPYYYKDSPNAVALRDARKMWVGGKYISKHHPLHKPGRYASWQDAFDNNTLEAVPAGDVYLISNKAWPEWVKIGKAVSAYDRLRSYQTSDPLRSYELIAHAYVQNRSVKERELHTLAEVFAEERRGEWFKINPYEAEALLKAVA